MNYTLSLSPGISRTTHRFQSAAGGAQLALCADVYANTQDQAPCKGLVVILHGYCEHRGRYLHVAQRLVQAGYQVVTADLRGHGEAGGTRAHVDAFSEYLGDVRAILDKARSLAAASSAPPVLLGHSMGGLVALRYVLEVEPGPGDLRGLVLSSPFLGLKAAVPSWKKLMGRAASRVFPALALPNDLSPGDLSHDPAVGSAYMTDPLVSHVATARWFTEAMAAQAQVLSFAPRLRLPTLLQQGGDDRIADPATSRAVFARLGSADKQYIDYPGLFHEIYNEVEKDRVLTDLVSWLDAHAR